MLHASLTGFESGALKAGRRRRRRPSRPSTTPRSSLTRVQSSGSTTPTARSFPVPWTSACVLLSFYHITHLSSNLTLMPQLVTYDLEVGGPKWCAMASAGISAAHFLYALSPRRNCSHSQSYTVPTTRTSSSPAASSRRLSSAFTTSGSTRATARRSSLASTTRASTRCDTRAARSVHQTRTFTSTRTASMAHAFGIFAGPTATRSSRRSRAPRGSSRRSSATTGSRTRRSLILRRLRSGGEAFRAVFFAEMISARPSCNAMPSILPALSCAG